MKIKAGKKLNVISIGTTTFKRILNLLLMFILIVAITYGFLTLVNWSYDLREFTRFSRFILGFEGVVFLIKLLDDL